MDDARIWQGDTLSNPQNVEDDNLMKFQVVVANPPFSLDKWDSGFLSEAEADKRGKKKMSAELDQYHRFDWGVPPTSKGDYAFVLHMLSSLDAENGRMAVEMCIRDSKNTNQISLDKEAQKILRQLFSYTTEKKVAVESKEVFMKSKISRQKRSTKKGRYLLWLIKFLCVSTKWQRSWGSPFLLPIGSFDR